MDLKGLERQIPVQVKIEKGDDGSREEHENETLDCGREP
jgi:hypothetical protein